VTSALTGGGSVQYVARSNRTWPSARPRRAATAPWLVVAGERCGMGGSAGGNCASCSGCPDVFQCVPQRGLLAVVQVDAGVTILDVQPVGPNGRADVEKVAGWLNQRKCAG
jgi:hypothetical protein